MTHTLTLTLTTAALLLSQAVSFGDTTLFDGTFSWGKEWNQSPAVSAISNEMLTPVTNHDTLKQTVTAAYQSSGMAFYGEPNLTVPSDETTLRLDFFSSTTPFSGINVDTSTSGSFRFNNSNGVWTVDGQPGQVSLITANTWHVLELDLTSIPDFSPGVTQLDGQISLFVGTGANGGATAFLGDITLMRTVPEPASLALMLGGSLLFVRRRR